MKQKRRVYYTEAQKTEMWDRWQKGESKIAGDVWNRSSTSYRKHGPTSLIVLVGQYP